MNGKISARFFFAQGKGTYIHLSILSKVFSMNEEAMLTVPKVLFLQKQAKQMWLLNKE